MYRNYVKRLLDVLLSLTALIFLMPLLLLIAIIIKVQLGSPIFFKQDRVGLDEKIFAMYKFRTMRNVYSDSGKLLPDNERVTSFGAFLRSTSLDELPELFNILKGDLSIVGPRPLLVSYLPYYTKEERIRHSVRGGLTVPEVIYGNVTPSWDEQFSYEIEYAKNVSFMLDLKIVWNTLKILLKRIRSDYGSEVRLPLNEERQINRDI